MDMRKEKWVYEAPVVKRICVELEDVIAGSREQTIGVSHDWGDEQNINTDANGDIIIIEL